MNPFNHLFFFFLLINLSTIAPKVMGSEREEGGRLGCGSHTTTVGGFHVGKKNKQKKTNKKYIHIQILLRVLDYISQDSSSKHNH